MANICIFTGNIGRDIEVKTVGAGNLVCNNALAVTEYYKGEKSTSWVPLTFWNKSAEILQEHCKKGSKILVTCKFGFGKEWEDKNGSKRIDPVFTVERFEFLDPKPQTGNHQGQQQNQGYQNQAAPQMPPANSGNNQRQGLNPEHGDFIEDDIPF